MRKHNTYIYSERIVTSNKYSNEHKNSQNINKAVYTITNSKCSNKHEKTRYIIN